MREPESQATMSAYEIRPFIPQDASDAELGAVHAFLSRMALERDPDSPPRTLDFTVNTFRSFTLLTDEKAVIFHAWHGGAIVGEVFIVVGLEDENSHLLSGDIQVLAGHRLQGIGTSLLRKVVEIARAENRRLIQATTDSAIPAGDEFARRVGASAGLVEETSQLNLGDVDRGLLAAWRKAAPAVEFRLLAWRGPCPEEFLDRMAALQEVMNTVPGGDLDYDDETVTPQDIRESEAYEAARGFERWTLVAQHRTSGELVGYTEVDWHPDDPQLLVQGDTVVEPEYRRRGLGRWLKASMIDLVLENRGQVARIRTESAVSNEAMLKINNALGFKCYKIRTEWQLELERAREYLATRHAHLPTGGRQ